MNKIVVDANAAISSLIRKGVPFSVFSLNAVLNSFEFIAPEFMLEEVKKHKAKALRFTALSEQEFEDAYDFLMDSITFIPAKEFLQFLSEAEELAPHPKDTPYLALALKFNCSILSGDKGLTKQDSVKILSPREVLSLLYNSF